MTSSFRLVDPDPAYQLSFLAAADEFIAARQERYAGITRLAAEESFVGVHFTREGIEDPAEFARLVAYLLAEDLLT